jgi:hypothetical protein
MPAASTITIADSVPANHVFNPQSATPGDAVFLNRNGNSVAAAEVLKLKYSAATSQRATDRINIRLQDPLERGDAVNGYTIAGSCLFDGDIVIPAQATATERANFAALVKNALANAVINNYIGTGEVVW